MTERQRKWTTARDGKRCQHLNIRNGRIEQCFITTQLEVHHIFSRRFAGKWFPDIEIDHPHNLITLCTHHHRAFVHPDIEEAFAVNDETDFLTARIEKVLAKRDILVAEGKPYWNTTMDGIYNLIARDNTLKCKELFPEKKGRKK